MSVCNILVIGSGSVTQNFCFSLATQKNSLPLRICILGRSETQTKAIVSLSNAVSKMASSDLKFIGDTLDWEKQDAFSDTITKYSPNLIFHTASLQSPWEFLENNSQTSWKSFIETAGMGITIPFQAILVTRIAKIIKDRIPKTILVNACYPDNVNPILKHLTLPITCGVGNVGMLASILNSLSAHGQKIRVIGHLFQLFGILGKRHTEIDFPRVWMDEKEATSSDELFLEAIRQLRGINSQGKIINQLVGATSVEIILALLGNKEVNTHVPGPNGLPGGYPVKIAEGKVTLHLPVKCGEKEAICHNVQGAYDMGSSIVSEKGFISFNSSAVESLRKHHFPFSEGFYVDQLEDVSRELMLFKNKINH